MYLKKLRAVFAAALVLVSAGCYSQVKNNPSPVFVAGAMKNVMWQGQLAGNISLDTISQKKGLYGVGPVEGLRGEILIINGTCYKSTVSSPTAMTVEENFNVKAPFFVYGYVKDWYEQPLPAYVKTLTELERFLENNYTNNNKPYIFRLKGVVQEAGIHVVNLPQGTTVSSPQDAHIGQANYLLNNEVVEIVGFFSKDHQSVFTHHDTFMHLHLITANKLKMGHLDSALFKEGAVTLYLPK